MMTSEDFQTAVSYVENEIKNNLKKYTNTSKRVIEAVKKVITEENGEIVYGLAIPVKLYYLNLKSKYIPLKHRDNFIEQCIINGVKKFLIATGKEGVIE